MKKKILALSPMLLVVLAAWVFRTPETPAPPIIEQQWFLPNPPQPDLDLYDDRAFEIASILERKRLSTDAIELLDLAQLILDKSEQIEVSPALLLAVIHVESTFDPCAHSRVGAKGLMQVMPNRILGNEKYYDQFAFNYHRIYDPKWNIAFGADYLGQLIKRFGSVETALVAYNAGPTRVDEWLREDKQLYSGYHRKVFANIKRFPREIQGSEDEALF